MNRKEINDEFNAFFEFSTSRKTHVTATSAKLFAEHIVAMLLVQTEDTIDDLLAITHKLERDNMDLRGETGEILSNQRPEVAA
jgi:hypothetical protein